MAWLELTDNSSTWADVRLRELSGNRGDYSMLRLRLDGRIHSYIPLSSSNLYSSGGELISDSFRVSGLSPSTTYEIEAEVLTDIYHYVGYVYFTTSGSGGGSIGQTTVYFYDSTSNSISYEWNDLVGATGYDYEVETASGSLVDSGWTTSTYNTTTGLAPNTTYYARVRGYAYGDTGPWSNWRARKTEPLAAPPTPTASKGTQTTSSSTINMSNYGNAEYFKVQGRRDDTSIWTEYSSFTYNPITISNLISGRTYDFRVQGVNSNGSSDWSNIVTFNIGASRPENWSWEYTISSGASFYNQSGSNVYLMRAIHWNNFTDRVNTFRVYKGFGTYTFTQATTTTTEVGIRNCINQAIDKVNDMVTSKIPNVYSGDTVKASTFILLRDRLNSL